MWIRQFCINQWKWGIYLSWNPTWKNCYETAWYYKDEHLNFNEDITNVCKSASSKLNSLSSVSSLLSYQQKKIVSNSFNSGQFNYCPYIWRFSSKRSYRKINKFQERSLRLCKNDYTTRYDELLSKQSLVNIHVIPISPYYEWDIYVKKYPIYHEKSEGSR